jgi:hypothetical protein
MDSTMTRLVCLFAALLLAAPVLAADEPDEHAGHHPPAAPAAEAPAQADRPDAAAQLQKGMQAMQDLMAKIRTTTDPAEKKRLLVAHMRAMEEQARSIRALYAKAGAHDHASGDQRKEGKGSAEGGMKKMHKQMEQRMEAVEQLLEQFIQHEAVEEEVEDD